jgi:hypothetical protein
MALVWRNYFDPPSSAPPPDASWLEGVHSKPMHGTRRAALEAEASLLEGIASASGMQILILFGSEDIYGATAERLFERYPEARHVVLKNTGHLPWMQSPEAFRSELCAFFGCCVCTQPRRRGILRSSRGPQPYRGGPTNSESYFWFISSAVLARSASSPCSARA